MKKAELLEIITKSKLVSFVLTNVKYVLGQINAACLLSADLRKCVSVMLNSSRKLIAGIFPSKDPSAKGLFDVFWESNAALTTLKNVLIGEETLVAAEFAASIGRFLRVLFKATGDGASLYSFYESVIVAKMTKEYEIRPVEIVLLREVAIHLANWDGAKDTRIDPVIFSKVFAVQQHIKTDVKILNPVLNSPLNAEAAAKAAADGCLGTVITHRGASNYINAVAQLPPSKHVVYTIITRLLSNCKSLSFQRCTSSVLLRSIPELKLSQDELNELYGLFQVTTKRDSLLSFGEVQNLFDELLSGASGKDNIHPPVPFESDVESGSLKCVKEADFSAYVVDSRIKKSAHLNSDTIAPILAVLGPTEFAEIVSSGRLDSLLPELVENDVCSSLLGVLAQYMKDQLDQSVEKLSSNVVSSSEWQRIMIFCSSLIKLGLKNHKEFREILTPEAQCEIAASALDQFIRRKSIVTESSSDIVTLFDFTSSALVDIAPPVGPRDPDDKNPLVSPILCKIILSVHEIYKCTVTDQNIQKFALVKQLEKTDPEAKLLDLIAGLVVGNFGGEENVFGPSFAHSFEALILALTRLFPELVYPIISVNKCQIVIFLFKMLI